MPVKNYYISNATDESIEKDIEHHIKYFAKQYKVEEALIRAIIEEESNNEPIVKRYEPHLKKAGWYLKLLTDDEKRDEYSYFSMGLMQVLFGIAKSHGYKGTPHELLNPKHSIAYGVLHLRDLIGKYYYLDKVISAYNQGTPRKYITGENKDKFKNQNYVDRVKKYYKKYKGKIK